MCFILRCFHKFPHKLKFYSIFLKTRVWLHYIFKTIYSARNQIYEAEFRKPAKQKQQWRGKEKEMQSVMTTYRTVSFESLITFTSWISFVPKTIFSSNIPHFVDLWNSGKTMLLHYFRTVRLVDIVFNNLIFQTGKFSSHCICR